MSGAALTRDGQVVPLANSVDLPAVAMAARSVSRPVGGMALPPLRTPRLLDQGREVLLRTLFGGAG